jgi:hypothetical protein
MLHKDYNHKCSVEKKYILVVILKGLVAKTNRLAENRPSWSNSDSDLACEEKTRMLVWNGHKAGSG